MTQVRHYVVTVRAVMAARITVKASSKAAAQRMALEEAESGGERYEAPERVSLRVESVREAGTWPATD